MLTNIQVNQYHSDGYTVQPQLFSTEEIAELLAEADRVAAGNTLAEHDRSRVEMEPNQPPDGTLLRRIYEPCSHYPRYRELSNQTNSSVVSNNFGAGSGVSLQQDQYEAAQHWIYCRMASRSLLLSAHQSGFSFYSHLPGRC